MSTYEFDAKFFTTISVEASSQAEAEKKANAILNRMTLSDPENPNVDYGLDTEDGIELNDISEDEEE